MANYCSVCGRKIGLLDSFKNIRSNNDLVCMICDGLLLDFKNRMWKTTDAKEVAAIKEEAEAFIHDKAPDLQNANNLLLLLDDKYQERMSYIDKSFTSTSQPITPPDPYTELCKKMILSTANTLEGYRITKQLGVVFGETVFKPSAGQQLTSAVGDMFRSLSFSSKEMSGQVQIIEEARKFAYVKMMKEAIHKGANAIIAIDSDNTIGESICYLSLYGTAVYAEPVSEE